MAGINALRANVATQRVLSMSMAFAGAERRVPIKHGTGMRAAMHVAGNDPEGIVYPDEAHGFLQVETNLDFWNRVEAFLAKNVR
jgi:dipeptidyl aminopeptidase/acylaminoacyl peptidase